MRLCKRTGALGVKRREASVSRHAKLAAFCNRSRCARLKTGVALRRNFYGRYRFAYRPITIGRYLREYNHFHVQEVRL